MSPRKTSLALELRKVERSVDPRIAEARTLLPTQRLALLDTVIDDGLEALRAASVETWLEKLKDVISEDGRPSVKKIMEFQQGFAGVLGNKAKVIAAVTQAIREMGNLVRKEIKSKPHYESLIAGMTPEDIAECNDEAKLKDIAAASLGRLAKKGLLTREILKLASDSLPPEIIPEAKPEKPYVPPPMLPDPEPIVLEPPEKEFVPL